MWHYQQIEALWTIVKCHRTGNFHSAVACLSMSSKAPFYRCCKVWCMCDCETFLSCQVGTGGFSPEVTWPQCKFHIFSLLRLRKHGDLPSLDWCFKHRDSKVKNNNINKFSWFPRLSPILNGIFIHMATLLVL